MDNEGTGDRAWNGRLRLCRRLGVFGVDVLLPWYSLVFKDGLWVVSIYGISSMKFCRLWLRTIDLITHRSLFYLSLRILQKCLNPLRCL